MEQSGIAFGNRAPLVLREPIAGRRSTLKVDDPSSTQVISQVPIAEQHCPISSLHFYCHTETRRPRARVELIPLRPNDERAVNLQEAISAW